VKLRLFPFSQDFRTAEQKARGQVLEQMLADAKLELEWQRRVQVNILRRQFGELSIFRTRQAD